MLRTRSIVSSVAAALITTLSGVAAAAPQDYRFEVVRVQPAGPGATDVSVRLVNVRDGKPAVGAVIAESTIDMAPSGMKDMKGTATLTDSSRAGIYHFRTYTNMAGNWALHLAATVPGETRIERTFIPTAKVTYTRTIRGEPEVVARHRHIRCQVTQRANAWGVTSPVGTPSGIGVLTKSSNASTLFGERHDS